MNRAAPLPRLLLSLLFLSLTTPLAAQEGVPVTFRTQTGTAWGESVYVLGDLPELGGGDVTRAKRMVPGTGGHWSLQVKLPAGADYRYVYVVRDNSPGRLAARDNGRAVSTPLSARVAGQAPLRTVKIRYLSGFQQVFVKFHEAGPATRGPATQGPATQGNSAQRDRQVQLQQAGAGRGNGEWIWEAEIQTRERELVFELHDGARGRDLSPSGARYRTRLSHFTLFQGRIVSGAPSPSALQRLPKTGRVVKVANWRSRILGNSRDVFVYLPPSYDVQTTRRYPVIYMHDGQNLFGPNAMFGGWRVENAIDAEVAAGRMQEVIVVGPANTSQRMSEYMPDADGGQASRYGRFLVEELKPWADRTLRTQPGRDTTAIGGSSLGGIVSLYLAWKHPKVFSKVASLSGSYWLKRWVTNLGTTPREPLQVWLDSGNLGGSSYDSLEDTIWVRDELLRRGWSLGGGLQHFVDYGASHNERYWKGRVGQALRYLFPAR